MSLTEESDRAYEASQKPLDCLCIGGSLDGQTISLPFTKHEWADKASGHSYFRLTSGATGKLRSFLIWKEMDMATIQARLDTAP